MAAFDVRDDAFAAGASGAGAVAGQRAMGRELNETAGRLMGAARSAARTLEMETRALAAMGDALTSSLGQRLDAAVELLAAVKGRIIVTGMGKSGHIGQKTAATFSSSGVTIPRSPCEASDGWT
ncbi:MAG: hypothetical protein AAGJ53_06635, partial [Pseudomonadota bacterium]